MRIIGFSKKWDKLKQPEFTTFRFPRKDRDWYVGETVQVYFHPRSKDREFLGIAEIIDKVARLEVSEKEAIADGFQSVADMGSWLIKTYGCTDRVKNGMNKLTLRWAQP